MTSSRKGNLGRALTTIAGWVLGVALVVFVGGVIGFFVFLHNANERGNRLAQESATQLVGLTGHRLQEAARDGELSDADLLGIDAYPTEIREVRHAPGKITVVALVSGTGPGLLISPGTRVEKCVEYEISLPPNWTPAVRERESCPPPPTGDRGRPTPTTTASP